MLPQLKNFPLDVMQLLQPSKTEFKALEGKWPNGPPPPPPLHSTYGHK